MSKNDEIIADYKIIDKNVNEDIFYKRDKTDINYEKKEDNQFQLYDEYCDRMNHIKFQLLKKTALAEMGSVVESTKDNPIIGTQALDTCYGILFYDRKSKQGVCGHAVPSQLISVISEMMKWLNGRSGNIEYMILPGFRNVERHDYRGLEELSDYLFKNVSEDIQLISFKDMRGGCSLHQDTLSYEFAFDTINGNFVTEYVFFDSIEHNPRYIAPKRRV